MALCRFEGDGAGKVVSTCGVENVTHHRQVLENMTERSLRKASIVLLTLNF